MKLAKPCKIKHEKELQHHLRKYKVLSKMGLFVPGYKSLNDEELKMVSQLCNQVIKMFYNGDER
jgi:hypothetical protein